VDEESVLSYFFSVEESSKGRIFFLFLPNAWHLLPAADLHIFAHRDAGVEFTESLLKSRKSCIIG